MSDAEKYKSKRMCSKVFVSFRVINPLRAYQKQKKNKNTSQTKSTANWKPRDMIELLCAITIYLLQPIFPEPVHCVVFG